jgi:hypothetical protein
MMKRWASALLTVVGLGLMAFPALAQGIRVNSTCQATGGASCGSINVVGPGSSAFLPYGFNITLSNGDIYQILGTANEALDNSGTNSISYPFLITYLGNTAGPQPSQNGFIEIEGLGAFGSSSGTTLTENLQTAGIFSGSIADGSVFRQSLSLNGVVAARDIGPFDSPGTFSGSTTVTAPAGLNSPAYSFDIDSRITFAPGSPVGSQIAQGSAIPVAAILPGSRSVQVGAIATVFGAMINTGNSTAANCQPVLPTAQSSNLQMGYQTTDPNTNAVTHTPNTPVSVASGATQTFVLVFQATAPLSGTFTPLFACTNYIPAQIETGVDTVDLLFSASPVPDIIALALTRSGDGTLHMDLTGLGAFAVATANLGISSPITVTATPTPNVSPLLTSLSICQTNPATGQCIAPPMGNVTTTINNGAEPTFSIFVSSATSIPFLPAINRISVAFTDSSGVKHGSTSVAVTSQ